MRPPSLPATALALAFLAALLLTLAWVTADIHHWGREPLACYGSTEGTICCYQPGCADIMHRYGAD